MMQYQMAMQQSGGPFDSNPRTHGVPRNVASEATYYKHGKKKTGRYMMCQMMGIPMAMPTMPTPTEYYVFCTVISVYRLSHILDHQLSYP